MPAKKSATTPRVHLDTPDDALENQPARSAPPKPKQDRPDPADERRRQDAFDSEFTWRKQSRDGTWQQESLEGFAISREALFGQLRLAMGAPPLRLCLADTDAFAADAHRILFLCAHPPEIWNRLRADMVMLQTAVDTWAVDHITPGEKLAAETLAMKIWLAAQENRHEPAPTGKPHGDDVGN